jgi:hypothetical protein
MSNLNEIAHRHHRDRWRDILFIGAAVLVAALSIGAATLKATAKEPGWSVTVIESNVELAR